MSADVESYAAVHTNQCIQKGFKISDPVTNKLCKYCHQKHDKEGPMSFPMKWLIAPCIKNYSDGL